MARLWNASSWHRCVIPPLVAATAMEPAVSTGISIHAATANVNANPCVTMTWNGHGLARMRSMAR